MDTFWPKHPNGTKVQDSQKEQVPEHSQGTIKYLNGEDHGAR